MTFRQKTHIIYSMNLTLRERLGALSLATLFQGLSVGIIIPMMTHFALSLGASEAVAPLIFSVYSLCAFLSSFFWGRICDKRGRKFVLAISAIGTTVSYAWLTIADSLWQIYTARALAGIMAGFTIAAFSYVADVSSENERAKGMGMIGASFVTGFVLGPAIGALLTFKQDVYVLAYFASSIMALLSTMTIIIAVWEPERMQPRDTTSLKLFLKKPEFTPIIALALAMGVLFTMIEGSFAIYLYKVFGASARDVAIVLIFAGICNIVVQGKVVGMIVAKIGEWHTIRCAVVVLFASFVSLIKIKTFGIYPPMILMALAIGLYTPALQSYASKIAPPDFRGRMGAFLQAISNFSRILGPAVATALMTFGGVDVPYIVGGLVVFAIYALLRYGYTIPSSFR